MQNIATAGIANLAGGGGIYLVVKNQAHHQISGPTPDGDGLPASVKKC